MSTTEHDSEQIHDAEAAAAIGAVSTSEGRQELLGADVTDAAERLRELGAVLRVSEAERSRGLGAAMLEWAHQHGRARGASLAQVTTDEVRERARSFYERLGYDTSHVGLKRPL